MSEDNVYQDAEIVWVKLRSCWWPGEVCSHQRQPEGLLKNTKRKPYCVVKFFQEESFEYVKNAKMIFPFNCSKKDEFIRKGHALLAKNKYMEQFPAAVSTAERLTRSVTRSSLFFNSRPDSIIKAILTDSPPQSERIRNGRQCEIADKILDKPIGTTDAIPSSDMSPTYKCTMCDFQSTRQNVLVLHRRSHSGPGSRPQRNSFVSRSVISPTNAKVKETASEIIKDDNKSPKIPVKNLIDKTPMNKKELTHLIKCSSSTEIKSDAVKPNEDYNKNLAKERPSKLNYDNVATVYIRPPPKKQLNFINCNKSENIQKSLLADWIDEDKEDEEENEEGDNNAKQVIDVDITSNVNKSNQYMSSISFASTSVSAEKLLNEKTIDQKTSVVITEEQKPTSKIRNIPKKDRRNIVFTDFNQSDDLSHMNSQSQLSTNDVCNQQNWNEENELCVPEKLPLEGPVTTELLIGEPCNTKTIAEKSHISNILKKAPSDKIELSFEDINISKPSNEAKKSTRHEVTTVEVPVEVMPNDMMSFHLTDVQDNTNEVIVEKCTTTTQVEDATADISKKILERPDTATAEIKTMVEPVTKESTAIEVTTMELSLAESTMLTSTAVTSTELKHSLEEPTMEFFASIIQPALEELNIIDTDKVIETAGKPSKVDCTIVESTIVNPSISVARTLEEQTTEERSTKEPTTIDPTKVEPVTVDPILVESVAVEPTTVERPTVEPTTLEPTTVGPTTIEPTTVEATTVEPTTIDPSTVEATTVEPTTIEPSTVEATTVEPATIEPSAVEPITLGPTIVEQTTLGATEVELTTVEPITVEAIRVEPTTQERTKVELTSVELTTVKPTTVEPSTEETTTEEPTAIELFNLEPNIVEPATEESTIVEPTTVKLTSLEPTTVEPATEKPTKLELTIVVPTSKDPTKVDTIVEVPTSVKPTVEEPITEDPTSFNSTTVEEIIVKPKTIHPTTFNSTTVKPNIEEANTTESFTEEPIAISSTILGPTIVKPITLEPTDVNPTTSEINNVKSTELKTATRKPTTTELISLKSIIDDSTTTTTEPIIGEIIGEQTTKIEPISADENEIDETQSVPSTKLNVIETKTMGLKHAEANEIESNLDPKILQVNTDYQSIAQTSSLESPLNVKRSSFKLSSIDPNTDEQNIVEPNILKLEPINLPQDSTGELNQNEKPSLFKKQSRTKKYKNSTITLLPDQPLFSSEIEEVPKETHSYVNPVFSELKSSDENPKVNTSSKLKHSAEGKKILKVKKPTLRSSKPRGCKRDTYEAKETHTKKETMDTSAKKIKLSDKMLHSSNEDQQTDSSFKADSLTIDQHLSFQVFEENKYDSESLPSKNETCIKITSKEGKTACSLPDLEVESEVLSIFSPSESIKTDELPQKAELCAVESYTSHESDVVTNPLHAIKNPVQPSESKSHVPVYLDLENAKKVSEMNEPKPRSSFSKASLACFDFNEEEDILTSIANFKKTYVSPEKNYNFGLENRPKTPDQQKLELEMKDRQLSADIESLLKTTTLPTGLTSSSALSSNRPLSNEVRGLPIKERGKRIFKSRNRFRVENCSSVSTTTTTETTSVSSSISGYNTTKCIPVEITDITELTLDIPKQDSDTKNINTSNTMQNNDVKTMDDKVTNSEEEIIGRIVFSPAEVYAPSNEEALNESVQIIESLVSSSSMEVNTKSLIATDENATKCNDNIGFVDNTDNVNVKQTIISYENEEADELKLNLLPSLIKQVGHESDDTTMEVRNEEFCLMSNKIGDQMEITAFHKDQAQTDNTENKLSTVDSSIVDEENVENKNNESSKLVEDQQANLTEDNGSVFAEENNDPDYGGKEMSVDEEIGKINDSNCESQFEYELVTTEVSTIVDHIPNEEPNLENAKESSTELLEEVVSCCDDGTFLNEMIIADVIESQSSVAENETDNLNETLKYVETEPVVIENPTDESNYCSINGINAQIYAVENNDIHVSKVTDARKQAEPENAESSSDDSSTIISDAEAEFGSPTSMLEEERVLNRTISGGETPATSGEGKGFKTLKKSSRKIRYHLQNSLKENKLLIQSLQCDTQESTSNDIVNELAYDANNYGNGAKDCLIEPKLFLVENHSFCSKSSIENELIDTETNSQANNELLEKNKDTLLLDEKDIGDSNYENSDSSEEDEEEICSPPIEPLLDEDTEAETMENYSTTTSLSKSEIGPPVDCEVTIVDNIVQEFQLEHTQNPKTKNETSDEYNSENTNTQTERDEFSEDLNGKQSNSYYTITQKSDTIIKLNKHKEKSEKGWTETSVDVRKSELAGEELTAAEALLLIPNQTTNILENTNELMTKHEESESADTLTEVKHLQGLLAEEEIKEESLECNDPNARQDLEQLCAKGPIPKELVRRKRRSHMKVTPRKRVIDEGKLEEKAEESNIETKIPKLTNIAKDPELQLIKSPVNFEDSFVLKYMKEQLTDEIDSFDSVKSFNIESDKQSNSAEKQTLEKVHITVDISNPLSSQIATILGTNRASSTEAPLRSGVKKRKMSVEDDIPSFIIKRPCPKTIAEEEAADRETIAQIQNLCPQVEITRKSSKDDQSMSTPTPQQGTTKPQIINQQILRAGSQPLITVTAKCSKSEEGIFDISNMPIVLSNEKIVNEKVHLVITPTTNQQIIKQLQNQHQLLSNTGTSSSNFSCNTTTASVAKPGIPVRRPSCVRTKRTPSRQQLPEPQQIIETQSFEPENYQQQINIQTQPNQQQEYVHPNQQLQHQHQIQQEHNQLQQQRQNTQVQVQTQNQFQQQLQQQQFQHHQNQIQQQLQEEQNMLMQQHHQLMMQQQMQLQQQLHSQQQLVSNEKASQSNLTEKQIGIDNRGNKYVIIRNPTNTVVMANSPEACKVQQQRVPVTADTCDQSLQRKQRQKKQSPLTVQIVAPAESPLPIIPPLPVTSPQPPHTQPQQYYKEQQNISPSIPVMRASTTKPKGRGRGRPPKNKTETVSSNKQTSNSNIKVNANGRRSTGRICEPPRQRPMRTQAVTTSTETHQSAMASTTVYTPNQQQTQSIGFMINPQFTSMSVGSSQSIRANNESYQTHTLGLSPQSRPPTATEISIETSEVSGGGYAVPSLPVPGYPQTYLLCELVGNKYKEVFSKPLYLSPDRTRFLEVPDELVTEAHTKLSDSRREPNPNALKLVSDGTPHILQSRLIEINSENMITQNDGNSQQGEVLMPKHQQLSVEEQASALLCLQEQLTQEQIAHKQISQDQLVRERLQEQLVQEQMVQEQFVEEQFVQEQFVQEQFVPEQFVQEQFVQEQFVQEQFVQEQFVQEQFVPEQFVQEQFNLQPQQFSLQLARFETGEVIEDAERGQMMVVTAGTHNMILDDKSFFEFTGEKKIDFYNAEKDTYVLTPQVISNLLHHYALGHITAVPALNTEIGDHQHEVSIADVIQNADSSTNILEVALDDSALYTEEQFINTGEILQIETPEGMQLIGTAAENADLIFHHMAKANTNETNVLLNQAPKMSAVEIPSDKSKRRFETKPSTPATLEDCLNVIGVPIQSPNVPTSLELPASVTNPAIVAKTRTPTPGTITMNEIIATGLCHHPDITSLPSMSSNDQELSYEFFPSNTDAHGDKDQVNEESVVTDMGEYAVVTSSASFDDPGR